jgi:F5/8 type C domain
MSEKRNATRPGDLQSRVAKVVWGLLFITMGVLFTLHSHGKIDMAPSPFPARNAVDGRPDTRWSSSFSEPEWIAVDLGQTTEITRVSLRWEAAYASAYEIQISDDNASWKTLVSVTNGDGGIDEHTVSAAGRYVRVIGTKRGTPYGFSLWELEVYGAGGLLSRGQPTMASSTESANYWALYWPLLLVAGGLPLLLVPRDSANQVIGLAMTVIGVFLQVERLQLTSWSLNQVLPVLLIAAGALLLLRSLWSGDRTEHTIDGDGDRG